MTAPGDDILEQALRWKSQGHGVALATVIQTWGSAPRPAGAQLAVCDSGSFTGSVSGGCVESEVVERALEIIKTGKAHISEFGISNTRAWEVGLACGGTIKIYIECVE